MFQRYPAPEYSFDAGAVARQIVVHYVTLRDISMDGANISPNLCSAMAQRCKCNVKRVVFIGKTGSVQSRESDI